MKQIEIDGEMFDDSVKVLRKQIMTQRSLDIADITIDSIVSIFNNPSMAYVISEQAKIQTRMIASQPIFPRFEEGENVSISKGGIDLKQLMQKRKVRIKELDKEINIAKNR